MILDVVMLLLLDCARTRFWRMLFVFVSMLRQRPICLLLPRCIVILAEPCLAPESWVFNGSPRSTSKHLRMLVAPTVLLSGQVWYDQPCLHTSLQVSSMVNAVVSTQTPGEFLVRSTVLATLPEKSVYYVGIPVTTTPRPTVLLTVTRAILHHWPCPPVADRVGLSLLSTPIRACVPG